MKPKRPMTPREILEKISQHSDAIQRHETNVEDLRAERQQVKANKIITDFLKMSKSEILELTVNEREILQWKILKALCLGTLEE